MAVSYWIIREFIMQLLVAAVVIALADLVLWLLYVSGIARILGKQAPSRRKAMWIGYGVVFLIIVPWLTWHLGVTLVLACAWALTAVVFVIFAAELGRWILRRTCLEGLGYRFGFMLGALGAGHWLTTIEGLSRRCY